MAFRLKIMTTALDILLQQAKLQPGKIEAMMPEERRAYNAAAKRASRDRQREALASGKANPSVDVTRELLADIAVMMLASDAPGSETIMAGLQRYFTDRVGYPIKIKNDCRRGKLKTKIIGKVQDAPTRTATDI
ncbi:hypothetical protein [Peteryoungia algae]|uniref:Uncharacterized protein n=1 Tax=Peteryoungia algae TaxID=2919917 RepID=A0ABT0CXC7_9HYPH|nr:hypothetical protein [Rhizobium sp. SSM4.3]MCJ8237816.1 hypothetical protein [Rhizobium sp. SSM4.3]